MPPSLPAHGGGRRQSSVFLGLRLRPPSLCRRHVAVFPLRASLRVFSSYKDTSHLIGVHPHPV